MKIREDFYGGYIGHGSCSYSRWTFGPVRVLRFGSCYTASGDNRPGGWLWRLW